LRLDAFERDLMSESFVAYCCQFNTESHSSTCINITYLISKVSYCKRWASVNIVHFII
jgi:hypothetical protein